MHSNQKIVYSNQSITKMSDSAAARTFATPELATMILCHLSPVQLYAVRQVNRTFHDCIAKSRYCRQVMLLEPGSAFSLFKLTKVLAARQLSTALYPFYISKINKRSIPQPHVLIEVHHSSVWMGARRATPADEELLNRLTARGQAPSWRHIKILSSNAGIKLHLRLHCGCFSHFIEFEGEVTLGEMLLKCMEELRICQAARTAEALASQARARRRRGNAGLETSIHSDSA